MLRKLIYCSGHPKHVVSISSPFSRQLAISSLPQNSASLSDFKILCYNGQLIEALLEMGIKGLEVKFHDYDTLLTECVNQRAIKEGQRVHSHMIKTCYLPPAYLGTRLIVFYNKCGFSGDARKVLDEMPERNVVSWTAMISAYSQKGYYSEALDLFVKMLRSGDLGVIYASCLYLVFSIWCNEMKVILY